MNDRERNRLKNITYRARHPERVQQSKADFRARYPYYYVDKSRRQHAHERGYKPPPPERDCPPRTDHCQYCHKSMDTAKVLMDHNHNTGAFCAWCCSSCNRRITDRMGDFGEGP